MTILLYTAASTKNGVSCWAWSIPSHGSYGHGVRLTANTAAMETLAVIEGLYIIPNGESVMVISDCLSVVKTITDRQPTMCSRNKRSIYHRYRDELLELCENYTIDSLWVASSCPNKHHVEVDQMCKIMLQEYLNDNCKSSRHLKIYSKDSLFTDPI